MTNCAVCSPPEPEVFTCDGTCGKDFDTAWQLQVHQQAYYAVARWDCRVRVF